MQLTEEQVLAMAPDEASKKSGKGLATLPKWVSKGVSEKALWGECQGSGSKPYQTQVDLANIAFKCSCPSRKFPCKHGLGLLLLYARETAQFTTHEEPAWVADWISKRTAREEKKVTETEKPVDEAAQAKRLQARQQKVAGGIDELRLWMKDIVRNGIFTIPEKGPAWFENIARRMVDAQAPGLAAMLRSLGELNYYTEGWQQAFMDQFLSLYLITEGYRHLDQQDELLQQDIRTRVGFTQNQEALKEQAGVEDTWLVLGKQSSQLDNIITEKYWLYGTGSLQYALILQFIVNGQGNQLTLTPGMVIRAELVYYPSSLPLRAILKKQVSTNTFAQPTGCTGWKQVVEQETSDFVQMPFRSERPYIVQQLLPVQYNNQWWLQDRAQQLMSLQNAGQLIWKLLAIGGGQPLDMAVIGKEGSWEPIGAWQQNCYHIL